MVRWVLEAGEGGGEDAGGAGDMNVQRDNFLDALPMGWTFDRLKDVVSLRNKKTDLASSHEDYLELEDLESGTGRILNRRNTLDVGSAVTLFKQGDVLFGKLRPYLEKFYESEFDGKCTGEILAFKPERIVGRFLFYCIGSRWFIERCNALAYGAKMPRVSRPTQLSQFNVPLPPRPEQERIAAYLDASCSAIDAAVAAKRRQISVLDDLQSVTIAKAVARGLDESVKLKDSSVLELGHIPAHWRQTKLRYEISIRSGDFVSDKLEDKGEYPVIGGNGEMGRAAGYNVDGEIVVVGRVGAHCGNAHYVKGRAWVSDNALIVESNHDKRFLTHLIRMLDFNSTAKKTAQPLVTGTQIKNTYVGMPQVAEQEKIVAFIENRTVLFASLRETLSSQIAILTAYRKSLIHECVTGQRRIAEADVRRAQNKRGPT
jgi:type I restriction enzyme S subunit